MTIPRFPLFDLSGRVAIVTGSSKGIGKAIARHLSLAGSKVVISSRKTEPCEVVRDEILAEGGEAIAVPCNISRKEELENLVGTTLAKWGRVDTLVCNAAISPYFGPMQEIDDDVYRKSMDANVLSSLWLSNLVRPDMATRRDGSIMYVSSIAGTRGSKNVGLYSLAKAADMQLARNLAVEYGTDNIRVNTIAPGLVKTDLSRARWQDEETYQSFLRTYPIGRIGEPEDLAGAAVLLASRAGAFITGQTIFVDGGVTIGGG